MSADRARFAPIDGLRGLAAMMVVLSHVYAASGYPYIAVNAVASTLDWLHSGVDLFFVLSGFCLFYPLTKPGSKANWSQFFRRRARRLLPPYYAAVTAVVLLPFAIEPVAGWLGLVQTPAAWPDWQQVWTHVLLVHTFSTATFYGLNGPFWSLGIEMQFYLAFPLAVWLVSRFEWRGVGLIATATLGYRLACMSGAFPTYQAIDLADLFPSRWMEFALGMLVATRVRRSDPETGTTARELGDLLGALSLFLVASYFVYGPARQWPYPPKDMLFAGLYSVVVYYACCPRSRVGTVLAYRVPVWLGTVSYSLYLIHLPIIFAVAPSVMAWHLGLLTSLGAMALVTVPLVLGCTALFFQVFERPFLNTAQTGLAQAQQVAGATALGGARTAGARAD